MLRTMWRLNWIGWPQPWSKPASHLDSFGALCGLADLARSLRAMLHLKSALRETTHEAIRPHRKAARHQARERLELETYLRKDRRLFRGADCGRHSGPDETDQTAGRERWRAVRPFQIRNRDAQRDADARHGNAPD